MAIPKILERMRHFENIEGKKHITNIADPINIDDVATKNYVDNSGGGVFYAPYGEVTFSEIEEAYDKNMEIKVVLEDGSLAELSGIYGLNIDSNFTPLEYIQTDGTNYIDTRYVPNENFRVVMDFEATNVACHLFGGRIAFQQDSFLICWETNFDFCIQVGTSTFNGGSFTTTGRHTVDLSSQSFYLDNNLQTSINYTSPINVNGNTLYIASCSNSDTSENMVGKIYSVFIYENNNPIALLIPARNNTTNKVGLYNTLTSTFFADTSGGNFTAGPALPTADRTYLFTQTQGDGFYTICELDSNNSWNRYNSDEFVTKDYIDNAIANINITSALQNIPTPTANAHAANKQYVDQQVSGAITEVQVNGTSVSTSGTANIPAASTSGYGVTQLSSSTSSTSTSLAATPSAVKSAYDLANNAATTANAAMPKSGGDFTGSISRNGTTTISSSTAYYRPIRVSTAAPTASDGNVGDIWIQYS